MKTRLIVGCGYVGKRVARLWQHRGDTVLAITRTQSRASELREIGIIPIVWDWLAGGRTEADNIRQSLGGSSHPSLATVLIAVSHATQPNYSPEETHALGLGNLLALLKECGVDTAFPKWIYLSTTGVFGASSHGEWIDESSAVAPERPGSIAALGGERWIANHIGAEKRVVLRPVGIYGPDRVPRWQSIRDQIPLQVDPESYLNLIHVDDLAAAIDLASEKNTQHQLYCVSDGEPVLRREYYKYISELGGWPPPVFEAAEETPTDRLRSRGDGNKRISNRRIQSEWKTPLLYPSYRIGLKSLLGHSQQK